MLDSKNPKRDFLFTRKGCEAKREWKIDKVQNKNQNPISAVHKQKPQRTLFISLLLPYHSCSQGYGKILFNSHTTTNLHCYISESFSNFSPSAAASSFSCWFFSASASAISRFASSFSKKVAHLARRSFLSASDSSILFGK